MITHSCRLCVLKHLKSALLKYQCSIGVVGVYSIKLCDELVLSDVVNFGKFPPILWTGCGDKLFTSQVKR